MKPTDFVTKFKPHAIKCQETTGLHYRASLVQAALESGWGEGATLFGIKDTDGVNGNEQLLTTQEVLPNKNYKFPVIISIVEFGRNFKYTIKDYFRKYSSYSEEFEDHAKFFTDNNFQQGRYKKAWNCRADAEYFLREVARAGYATDPLYEKKLIDTLDWFKKFS